MQTAGAEETQAGQSYRLLKRAILRGEFPEGVFLVEAEILSKYDIGRTPFREACNRLLNEQILEAVPRRGFRVPELTFRAVRDLLETRLILEGIAAELAALRSEASEVAELERLYKEAVATARNRADVDAIVESNREFHLQIARMAHNGEFESVLRGVLERGTRLIYLVVRSSAAPARDAELLLKPIVQAIRARDAKGAHEAVIHDITRGQMNLFGRDMWAAQPGRVAKRTQKEE